MIVASAGDIDYVSNSDGLRNMSKFLPFEISSVGSICAPGPPLAKIAALQSAASTAFVDISLDKPAAIADAYGVIIFVDGVLAECCFAYGLNGHRVRYFDKRVLP